LPICVSLYEEKKKKIYLPAATQTRQHQVIFRRPVLTFYTVTSHHSHHSHHTVLCTALLSNALFFSPASCTSSVKREGVWRRERQGEERGRGKHTALPCHVLLRPSPCLFQGQRGTSRSRSTSEIFHQASRRTGGRDSGSVSIHLIPASHVVYSLPISRSRTYSSTLVITYLPFWFKNPPTYTPQP